MHELQGSAPSEKSNAESFSEENSYLHSHIVNSHHKLAEIEKESSGNICGDTNFANIPTIDKSTVSNTYVVMEPKSEDPPTIPCKRLNGKTRSSVFDDSDYDEVIDFMASSNLDPVNTEQHLPNAEMNKVTAADGEYADEDSNSYKRSSASSVSTASSSTSGVESGEEKTATSTYANLDIAKILHTRKRIHRILQTSVEGEDVANTDNQASHTSNNKKKSSGLAKRSTQYGTIGRNKPPASNTRSSRPSSSGGDDIFTNGFITCDLNIENTKSKVFHQNLKSEKLRKKSLDSDEDEVAGIMEKEDTRRWSRLSSASNNNDKTSPTSHKGPWKAFKKFVNSASSPRAMTHEELKASIHIQHNTNESNNVHQSSFQEEVNLKSTRKIPSNISSSSVEITNTSNHLNRSVVPQIRNPPPKRHTNSLMRRFSRKSSSKRQIERRKSLPVESALAVNENSAKSRLAIAAPLTDVKNERKDISEIESMVMASVQNRLDEDEEKKQTLVKSQKTSSFRKRFLSFSRKRSSSQERKSILKTQQPIKANDSNAQISKSLSYSSPQLSIFSVNARSQEASCQNLDF